MKPLIKEGEKAEKSLLTLLLFHDEYAILKVTMKGCGANGYYTIKPCE